MKTIRTTILFFTLILSMSCTAQSQEEKKSTDQSLFYKNVTTGVEEQLKKHKLQGISVAVFEDYKITWTREWGVKASDSDTKIDQNTAFSTASITKPIVAILCGILEEKGLIDLEEPIAKYLKRWHLPKSELTKGIEITWLHLLSHTAGTTQGGFADFYKGDTIPTIVQSLKGQLLPRYDKEISFLFKPGTDWEYSGGGYVIVQLALEDHLEKSLSDLVTEHLFEPLQLQNTTLKQPNEKGFLVNVAKVHDSKGNIIKTGLPITPQVAPSGMWSTPSDMAIIALEMQNALRNQGNTVISNSVAKKTTMIATLKKTGGWSHGWQRSFGFGNIDWFSHGGSNTGVGGELMASMKDGRGIAILANGDRPNRTPVINYVRSEIMKLLYWNISIDETQIKQIPRQLAATLQGSYTDFLYGTDGLTQVFEDKGKLFVNSPLFKHLLNTEKNEMFYLGDHIFKINNYPNYIQFNIDKNNGLQGIVIYRDGLQKNKIEIPITLLRTTQIELISIFRNHAFNQAIQKYQNIKNKNPDVDFENILNTLGILFYDTGDIDLSVQVLEFTAKEYSNSWRRHDILGEIYEITDHITKSIEAYKKARILNTDQKYKKEVDKKLRELQEKL